VSDVWDVVVVGAGIVGSACALECAQRGLRTAVVEGSGVGSGATAAAMGHVVVMHESEPQLALTRYSQSLWRTLGDLLPADVEFEPKGTLWIAADEAEMEEVRRKQRVYAAAGLETEVLDGQALEEAEPYLRRPMAGALLVASDLIVDPARSAVWLMDEAMRAGATLYVPPQVVQAKAGRVELSDGTVLAAEHIVIACGAESKKLLPELPIRKRKGHLAITECCPGLVRHQLVELGYLKSAHTMTEDSVAFNVQPRRTGEILIGSSRQFGDEKSAVNETILAAMLERAKFYLPGIGTWPVARVWTGFRAATLDKLPLIGPWPPDASVMVATGHEGLGITTSLATGKLIADQLTGDKSEIPIEPYWPERFFTAPGGAEGWEAEAPHG